MLLGGEASLVARAVGRELGGHLDQLGSSGRALLLGLSGVRGQKALGLLVAGGCLFGRLRRSFGRFLGRCGSCRCRGCDGFGGRGCRCDLHLPGLNGPARGTWSRFPISDE